MVFTGNFNEDGVLKMIEVIKDASFSIQSEKGIPLDSIGVKYVGHEGYAVCEVLADDQNTISLSQFYAANEYLLKLMQNIRNSAFTFKEVSGPDREVHKKTQVINPVVAVYELNFNE